jgi:hypothetical protein
VSKGSVVAGGGGGVAEPRCQTRLRAVLRSYRSVIEHRRAVGKPMPSSWITRPVFISSTFPPSLQLRRTGRDMQAERDCLRNFVSLKAGTAQRHRRCWPMLIARPVFAAQAPAVESAPMA